MRKHINECGARNSFGYLDTCKKAIILKHPCFIKSDVEDVYGWLEDEKNLNKLSIGIGMLDNIVGDDTGDNIYGAARGIIHQNLSQSEEVDNEVLKNILKRMSDKKQLTNLGIRCYIFSENQVLFDMLLQVIKNAKELVYLDLSGCYFSDEQLLDLAQIISQTHIAHLIWPEPRMTESVTKKVADMISGCLSLVVLRGVPLDFQKIAQEHRQKLFTYGRSPTMIATSDALLIKEYKASIRIAIAFEKQRLFDLEKAFEAVMN